MAALVTTAIALLALGLASSAAGQAIDDPKIQLGIVTTVLGDGGFTELPDPHSIAMDAAGNRYIALTTSSCQVIRVTPAGVKTVIAGTLGNCNHGGDGGPAAAATFNGVFGVAVNAAGTRLYVGEFYRIRRIVLDAVPPTISTVGGTGVPGYNGNNLAANVSRVNGVSALALNEALGQLYFAEETGNRVRRIDLNASPRTMHLVAGTGTPGFFGDGGKANVAHLHGPTGLATSADNTRLFVADTLNHRVRVVFSPAYPAVSTIHTVAGNGVAGTSGDGGSPTAAAIESPSGLALSRGTESVLLVSSGQTRVRLVRLKPGAAYITTLLGTGTSAGYLNGPLADTPASLTRVWTARALHARDTDARGNFIEIWYGESAGNRLRKLTVPSWGVLRISSTGTVSVNKFSAY